MKGCREIENRLDVTRVILLILYAALETLAEEAIPKSLSTESGDYCNVRCLAKCVRENGNGVPSSECESKCTQYDSNYCPAGDRGCWRTCRNTMQQADQSSAPKAPRNVTVSYVSHPQPNPWEADVRWRAVETAHVYVIQYIDKSDVFKTWAKGGLGMSISFSHNWKFVKPNLCPEYAFRVAAVNEYGTSSFSEVVNLPSPKPVVPAAQYSVRSAELLNEPFLVPAIDSDPLDNKTVQVEISFAPPPNWSMKRDIKRVSGNLHVLFCERLQAFAPYIRWKTGEPEFEVRLPGSIAAAKANCKMIFTVEDLYTKCDEAEPTAYPDFAYDAEANETLPGFTFDLSCSNIHHSVCPYVPISFDPSCGVSTYHAISRREDNYSSDATATIEFGQLLAPKDAPLRFYQVRYGESGSYDSTTPETFRLPNITGDVKIIKLENNSRDFNISNLDVRKSYAFQICALYNEHTEPKWDRAVAYPIDLSNLLRPDDLTGDNGRARGSDYRLATYVAAVAVPIIVALVVALAVFTFVILRYKRAKSIDQLKVRPQGWDDERYIDMPDKIDKWEIDREHLIIYDDDKLGSGAFGSVFRCKVLCPLPSRGHGARSVLAEYRARVESGEAAVKLLPEFADDTSKSDFRREINLMKNLGYHERLVNMLGCITVSEPLCLVVEYCRAGDLLHYLRERRNYMIKLEENGIDLNNLTENDEVNLDLVLCFKDLTSFAWQISVGLEYLSQKGYIHRDVAARNVLVDKGKHAKIGDFGLCRYSYDDSVYLSHGGRLPIKWMALEAIKNYEFTTKSDVWSYGVLLFEIITMGGNPYPGLQPTDVEVYLEAGKRMEQPDNCPPVLYAMMLDCWRSFPDERPTFTQLRERLRVLLEEVTFDYSYLCLNQARDYYNIVPMEYPPLAAIQTRLTEIPLGPVEDEHEALEEGKNPSANQLEPGGAAGSDSACGSTATTPSAMLTGQQRDSNGSDQYLITPTTPKYKFFKFKSSKNGLAALPESGNSDENSCGISYSNGAYVEELVPKSAVDLHMQSQAVS